MQLRRLHLENFQSIKGPVTLDLAPITLLYGPNSAGKSAIGDGIELAFKLFSGSGPKSEEITRWCHMRDASAEVRIGLGGLLYDSMDEMQDLDDLSGSIPGAPPPMMESTIEQELAAALFPRPGQPDNEFDVIVTLARRRDEWLIQRLEVVVGGHSVIACSAGLEFATTIHLDHTAFNGKSGFDLAALIREFRDCLPPDRKKAVEINRTTVHIHELINPFYSSGPSLMDMVWDPDAYWTLEGDIDRELMSRVTAVLRTLLILPARLLAHDSRRWARIGPLRSIPTERQLTTLSADGETLELGPQWQDGTMAWRELLSEADVPAWPQKKDPYRRQSLVHAVNEWIANDTRLALGYEICRKEMVVSESAPRQARGRRNDRQGGIADGTKFSEVFLWDQTLGLPVAPRDVGTGISQVLPILVRLSAVGGSSFIEQPELHVHPRLQAQLADFAISKHRLAEQLGYFHCYILESHSEHLALRVLRRVREGSASQIRHREFTLMPDEVAFYYFEPKGNETIVHRLRVDSQGRFVDPWPQGFFDERSEDLFS